MIFVYWNVKKLRKDQKKVTFIVKQIETNKKKRFFFLALELNSRKWVFKKLSKEKCFDFKLPENRFYARRSW